MRHPDTSGLTRADLAPIHIARETDHDTTLCGRTVSASETIFCADGGSKAVGCRTCQKIWSKRTGQPYPQPTHRL